MGVAYYYEFIINRICEICNKWFGKVYHYFHEIIEGLYKCEQKDGKANSISSKDEHKVLCVI